MALLQGAAIKECKPYKIEPYAMGALLPLDNIGAVLEEIEGPHHR